jgi:hypothetical protein
MLNRENQSMKKNKTAWRWWAKALGEKASKCDKESDRVAIIRTFIFVTYLITNAFIVAGVIRHWNDETKVQVLIDSSVLPEYQQPSRKGINKPFEFE